MSPPRPREPSRKRATNVVALPAAAAAPPSDPGKSRKGIQSVEIGLRVLNVLVQAREALPLKDISRTAGLSASQTHRYLTSLMRQEMVVQDPANGRYDLGKMALRVGLSALNRIDALQIAEDALRSLVDRVGDTGMLCVWSDRGPIAIRWRRGRTLILSSVGVGTTFPLLGAVSGHVFLAYMPSPVTRPLLEAELAERVARGRPIAEAEVAEVIARVRSQRYSAADGHIVPEMRAMSAPILDHQGEIVAALTLVGATEDSGKPNDPMLRELLRATAQASEALGFGVR
jgi:DNA-binding IclR family transcriptional regulator